MIGARVQQYEVIGSIGAGGMGEVFRARDTRLSREVALKLLPKGFAADSDRLRRFEQEAKLLATLNHPNILTIHDAGVHEGAPYLVSELLEGQTLRQTLGNLNGASIPQRKATDYALQIARGLAAAHGKGVIHRDLKPENVFVTRDGRVKILDFGLAKLHAAERTPGPWMKKTTGDSLPTLVDDTQSGVVLGTPAYMSPEQVRAQTVDHRSDIFAFGCVLYEMLTGARAFRRDTPVQSMNAILSEEPPELALGAGIAMFGLAPLVQRCLQKEPEDRFQSAKDLAFALEVISNGSGTREALRAPSLVQPKLRTARVLASAGLLVLGLVLGLLLARWRTPVTVLNAPSIRHLTYSGRDYSPSASLDGKRIWFSSDRDGSRSIWVKDLTSGSELALTDGPDDFPRISRDGSAVLFTRAVGAKRALFRAPAIGKSEPFKVVDDALSGDWSPSGREVAFVRWPDGGGSELFVIGIDGSGPKLVHRFTDQRCSLPRWSPDGKTIAVSINDSSRPQALGLISVTGGALKLVPAPHAYNLISSVAWDGAAARLFFMQAESISANSSGSTAALFCYSLASDKVQKLLWSAAHSRVLDWLPTGNILLDTRSSRQNLKELRLGGSAEPPRSLTLGNSTDRQPVYSHDGKQVVFSSNRSGNLDLWSIARDTGRVRRLTDDPGDDWDPGFSPDGRYLIWSANRGGNLEIWIAEADGSSQRQLTHDGFAAENPTMTPDNSWLVYASTHPEKAGLWKIDLEGKRPVQLLESRTCGNAEVSPDGKYVAYVESKRTSQVFVRVLELESGKDVPFSISVEASKETAAVLGRCRWMPGGKAIAFLGQDDRGINGVYVQDFIPGADTASSRRPVGGFDSENSAESFGIAPDGKSITIATWEQFYSVMATEDLTVP